MTAKELFQYLTQDAGLDDVTAQAIMKAADNEKVTSRAAKLKAENEWQSIQQRADQLQALYDGQAGKPGAKTYQEWYEKNFAAIQKLQQDAARYQERFGPLDEQGNPTKPQAPAFDEAAVQKLVDQRIQQQYGPQWSSLLKGSGRLIEKHLRSGRKNEIDWDKVSEIAAAKGGDLVAAYDEWDAPLRQEDEKNKFESEVQRRVKEEMAKRQTAAFFPASADASSTDISPLSRAKAATGDAKPTYDRNKVIEAAVNPGGASKKQWDVQ